MGNGVFIGPGAQRANDRYPRAVTPEGELKKTEDWTLGHVVIEDGASIGAGAIVVPDARVGRWAMVGAAALVTKDVPAHQLVAGNPARPIGYVCMCGHRLAESSGKWQCSNCGRDYDLPPLRT